MSRPERQEALDDIADQCKLPRSVFALGEGEELHFHPATDANFDNVSCALNKLKTLGPANMGFVGNEAYSNEIN
jgi:hypothetical protein